MELDAIALVVVELKSVDSLYVLEIKIAKFISDCKHIEVKMDHFTKIKLLS